MENANVPDLKSGGPRAAALAFIFVTVALDMLAIGIIVPVLPKLVVNFMGGDTARAAAVFGWFGMVWAAMQFLCAPVLGALSDRFGRRPVILLSNFGLGLDYILMALAPNLGWLFVGRVVSGITAASVSTANAYIADVTPPEKRGEAFGMLAAAFGLGFILGPALGGLLGQFDPRLPFWVAAMLSLLNAGYGLFVLPESLAREQRSPFAWRRANPVAALGLLRSHPELFGVSVVVFLSYLAHEVFPSVYVLYAGYRFGWGEGIIGATLATAGAGSAVVQAVLTRPVVTRLGERGAMLVGICFGVSGFVLYGLASRGWVFWLAVPVTSLWGLASPATQGIMSRRVGASEQGRLQGATSSLRGITGMIGPGLFTQIFAASIGGGWIAGHGWHLPGASFLLSALMLLAALGVAWRVTRPDANHAAPSGEAMVPSIAPPAFTSETP